MSARPVGQPEQPHLQLAAELDNMREQAMAMHAAASVSEDVVISNEMAGLTDTERSAASLGVHPDSFRPIGFLNSAHYQSLLKSNAIGGRLAQQLESYKIVSSNAA